MKHKAISLIKQIQTSQWDRNKVDVPKGNLAKRLWDDVTFAYGMEYGAIAALMQLFNLTEGDLNETTGQTTEVIPPQGSNP